MTPSLFPARDFKHTKALQLINTCASSVALAAALLDMARDFDLALGNGLEPETGCTITRLPFGDASVQVEYEYVKSDRCRDVGIEGEIDVRSVYINGLWVEAGLFGEEQVEVWRYQIDHVEREARYEARIAQRRDAEETFL